MKTSKDLIVININRLIKERGISQAALARAIGLETLTVHHYTSGNRFPKPENIDAICTYFNISMSELFTDHEAAPTVLTLPVSKTLQKMMKIPDEVYERASRIDINDSIWEDAIIPALVHAEERKRLANLHKT